MKMIRVILILFCLFSIKSVVAQADSTQNRQVKNEVENYLSDKEYTRIPNKDFDRILQNSVDEEVKDRLMFWLTIISIAIAGFGGVAALAFNLKIKQIVQNELENKKEELISEIKELGVGWRLNRLVADLGSLHAKVKTNVKSAIVKLDAYRLLEESRELENDTLVVEAIDVLADIFFSERNVQEFDELIDNNEKDYKLNAKTYANAAILNMDSYELDAVKKYKENCIKYCQAAINRNIYYGDPRSTLILVHAIDYVKATMPSEKENAKNNVRNVISEIVKATSGYIASNTCKRLEKDRIVPAFSKYFSAIKESLKEDFKKLYEKAKSHDDENYLSKSTM